MVSLGEIRHVILLRLGFSMCHLHRYLSSVSISVRLFCLFVCLFAKNLIPHVAFSIFLQIVCCYTEVLDR